MIRLLKPTVNPQPWGGGGAFPFAVAQPPSPFRRSLSAVWSCCVVRCVVLLCGPAAGVLLQERDGASLAWLATVSVSPLTSASRQCLSPSHPSVCWEALSTQLPHCAHSSLPPWPLIPELEPRSHRECGSKPAACVCKVQISIASGAGGARGRKSIWLRLNLEPFPLKGHCVHL